MWGERLVGKVPGLCAPEQERRPSRHAERVIRVHDVSVWEQGCRVPRAGCWPPSLLSRAARSRCWSRLQHAWMLRPPITHICESRALVQRLPVRLALFVLSDRCMAPKAPSVHCALMLCGVPGRVIGGSVGSAGALLPGSVRLDTHVCQGFCRARADPRAGMDVVLCVRCTPRRGPLLGDRRVFTWLVGRPALAGRQGGVFCDLLWCDSCPRCVFAVCPGKLLPAGRWRSASLATQPCLRCLEVGCCWSIRRILVDMRCRDRIKQCCLLCACTAAAAAARVRACRVRLGKTCRLKRVSIIDFAHMTTKVLRFKVFGPDPICIMLSCRCLPWRRLRAGSASGAAPARSSPICPSCGALQQLLTSAASGGRTGTCCVCCVGLPCAAGLGGVPMQVLQSLRSCLFGVWEEAPQLLLTVPAEGTVVYVVALCVPCLCSHMQQSCTEPSSRQNMS